MKTTLHLAILRASAGAAAAFCMLAAYLVILLQLATWLGG